MGLVFRSRIDSVTHPSTTSLVSGDRGMILSPVYRTTRHLLSALAVAVRRDASRTPLVVAVVVKHGESWRSAVAPISRSGMGTERCRAVRATSPRASRASVNLVGL